LYPFLVKVKTISVARVHPVNSLLINYTSEEPYKGKETLHSAHVAQEALKYKYCTSHKDEVLMILVSHTWSDQDACSCRYKIHLSLPYTAWKKIQIKFIQ
jgi:hypothetical protein